jgi:predicted ATPase/DNA-binding SARP family transcriptional activator
MAGGRWRVEVLGPVRVLDDTGADRTPGGALQRRLLALLVLHRGAPVSADAAVEALWPRDRPRDAVAALQTHLFRLRRALPAGAVTSDAAGYRLDPAAVRLDADDLAAALHAAATGTPGAAEAIAGALARWRGPAYPELTDVDAGRTEASRLEELRVQAIERRAEARLAAGEGGGELAAELAALAAEHPLRERPRALLMAALAAGGRPVEAMRVYDEFRRLLGDELGIEPSPELAARHAELVRGGPAETWTPVHRLPLAVTSLVGREELATTTTELAGSHRLVTLLGPGGVGKTRLGIEVGHRLRDARPDRPVVLCELAAADARAAVDAVAAALGIDGRPDQGLAERLATVLADVEVFLVLDNCEHVLEPIAALAELLLARCPAVGMLATSRERLRVPGEQLVTVAPLAAGGADDPAERLFVERARAVQLGFEPSPRDRERIGEIVRRLDGLPLAIELAAARLHTLDVAEVAAGLDRRFRLLTSGSRTSTRHGSLHAAVGWSVGQLDDELRHTYAAVSAFAATFDIAGASAVSDRPRPETEAALDGLVERSLVTRAPGGRYALLETLRAFGGELLDDAGIAPGARRRHARYFVEWTEHAARAVLEPGGEAVFAAIDDALPELRAALNWALDQGELELAGRLVVSLSDYGWMHSRPDVLAWAERITAADPDDASPLADCVWAVSAFASWMAGDVAETGARADRAMAVAERRGDVPAMVHAIRGSHALFDGRLDDVALHYRRARAAEPDNRARRINSLGIELLALAYAHDPGAAAVSEALLAEVGGATGPHAAFAWYCAGEADLAQDPARARARFARAVELADEGHAAFVLGIAGTSNASLTAQDGDLDEAAEAYRGLLEYWRRAGSWSTQWTMLRSVAVLLEAMGRPRESAVLAGAVLATDSGHRIFGEDAAALARLGERLRSALGAEAYAAATAEGARLDGPEAVEHALRSL